MKRFFRISLIAALLLWAAVILSGTGIAATRNHVDVLTVKGQVNPVLADYLKRGIGQANSDGAVACIITLDTPGGLITSTQEIVQTMQAAKVPVIVWVNKWAGSAGTFITLAGDVAAIAPGSRIGAASPVSSTGEAIEETMKKKLMEDTAAYIRALADETGRNKGAAIAAVIEAASYSTNEALGIAPVAGWEALGIDKDLYLKQGPDGYYLNPPLVDIGAETMDDLLNQLAEGITLANGSTYSLPTQGAVVKNIGMGAAERFLYTISDANIAYILLSIAMLGITVEISSPGLILPGVVGGICFLMAMYALGVLQANYAGIGLVVLAFGLLIGEIFTPGFGALGAGGIICLILGSMVMFRGSPFTIDPWVMVITVLIIGAIFAFYAIAVWKSQRSRITTGKEGLIGELAVTLTSLEPQGLVTIEGERWRATTEGDRIDAGEEVLVTRVQKLLLTVVRKPKGKGN